MLILLRVYTLHFLPLTDLNPLCWDPLEYEVWRCTASIVLHIDQWWTGYWMDIGGARPRFSGIEPTQEISKPLVQTIHNSRQMRVENIEL